jgi:hypothetical protein
MKKSPFVTLVFQGRRFGEASMPLETLPELAAYRDLVLEAAKALFQARNPNRQRLPKGFESGLQLVLEKVIEGGSAVPQISRVTPENLDLFSTAPAGIDLFEEARDIIERGIAQGGVGESVLPSDYAKQVLSRFGAFGRTLAPDEAIIVAQPGQREGSRYTREVRRRLVLQAQPTYEDEVDLVGEVRAADKDSEGFNIRTTDGARYPVRVPPLFFPVALRSLTSATLVRVRGTGVFDDTGKLTRITTATDVSMTEEDSEGTRRPGCPTPVEAQVRSLAALPKGWFDDFSPSYRNADLDWLAALLKGLLDGFELPNPYLYPTPEGMARAEWSGVRWEVIVNLNLSERVADVIAARIDSDRVDEDRFALTQPGTESKLGRFLIEHLEAT